HDARAHALAPLVAADDERPEAGALAVVDAVLDLRGLVAGERTVGDALVDRLQLRTLHRARELVAAHAEVRRDLAQERLDARLRPGRRRARLLRRGVAR